MTFSKDIEQPFKKGEPNPCGKYFTGQTYLNITST